jgi:subtilisin-like proprotein convertase family protein
MGWTQNAAGFWFHNWYGFGLVNADDAVAMAQSYSGTLGTYVKTEDASGTWLYTSSASATAIPDHSATGTSSTITVNHNFVIEAVQVQFTTDHSYLTDLGVELTSPSGTKSILLNINSGAFYFTPLGYDAQLLSNAFFGEQSKGEWKLKVIDGFTSGTGNFLSWKINVVGHVNPTPSDTTAPDPVTNIIHALTYNSTSSTPVVTWTSSPSSDVMRYEVSVGTSIGDTSIQNWKYAGTGNSIQLTDLSLTMGQTYYFNIRAVDTSENVSPLSSSFTGWTVQ